MRVLTLFFLTGASAIAAEATWLRLLQPAFGSSVEATAAVVALFLAGLAGGALLFGGLTPRIRRPVRAYILLAGAAGAILIVSPGTFRFLEVAGPLGRSIGVAALLLPVTVLLGGTWPILAETIPQGAPGSGVGALSTAHNLGGAAGGLIAGFLVIPRLGISAALIAAGGCLIAVAAAGYAILDPTSKVSTPHRRAVREVAPTAEVGRGDVWRWALIYAAAGLAFIGLEVSWTRLFSLLFQNTVYTFSAILALYLAGVAIGAWIAAWFADRLADPERAAGMALGLSACLGLLPALTFGLLLRIQGPWRSVIPFEPHNAALIGDLSLAAIVILPSTLAMGTLFPLLGRIVGEGRESLGRPIGATYGAGTLGSIFGGPVAGFVLIPAVGVIRSIGCLGAVAIAAGLAALWRRGPGDRTAGPLRRVVPLVGVFLVLVLLLEWVPPPEEAALRPGERLLDHREGRAAHAAVVVDREGHRRLRVNRSYSMGGDLGVRVERRQGILPVLLHPTPGRALVIGLGTGVTLGAVASDPEVEVVCAEILPEVIALSDHFRDDHGGVLSHPRVSVVKADGRTFLRDSGEGWDLIISDLFFPWRPGVGPLYAREHFETARASLRPGGVCWQWFALHQLTQDEIKVLCHTFAAVFPEVEIWMAELSAEVPVAGLAGSEEPLGLDVEERIDRLGNAILDPIGLASATDLLALRVAGSEGVRALSGGAAVHTDDHPIIEFTSPPNFFRGPLAILKPNLQAFVGLIGRPEPVRDGVSLGTLREAAAWCLRAEIERIDGEPVREMQAHFRALDLVPDLERPRDAILHRARAYLDGGKPESARQVLEEFLEVFPDDVEARRMLEQVK